LAFTLASTLNCLQNSDTSSCQDTDQVGATNLGERVGD